MVSTLVYAMLLLLFAAPIFARERHAPDGGGAQTPAECLSLVQDAELVCSSSQEKVKGEETLAEFLKKADERRCADFAYPHREQSAFYKALDYERKRLAGSAPRMNDDFQEAVDSVLLGLMHSRLIDYEAPGKLKRLAQEDKDSSIAQIAAALHEAASAVHNTPHPIRADKTFLETLEFLPIFDPEPITPLQNMCGFFRKRHEWYWYQPRTAVIQTFLALSFRPWLKKPEDKFPEATYALAQHLSAMDPSGTSFQMLIPAMTKGDDSGPTHVWLNEAVGRPIAGPVNLSTRVDTQFDGDTDTVNIRGHCEPDRKREDGLPLLTARNFEELKRLEKAYINSEKTNNLAAPIPDVRFRLQDATTSIRFTLKQEEWIAFAISCNGFRYYLFFPTGKMKPFFESKADVLAVAKLLKALDFPRGELNDLLPKSDWTVASVEDRNLLGGHNQLRTNARNFFLQQTGNKATPSEYIPFLLEELDKPYVALYASKSSLALRPLLVSKLYDPRGSIEPKRIALALKRDTPLPKRLRRFIAERWVEANYSDSYSNSNKASAALAKLLTPEERKHTVLQRYKDLHINAYGLIAKEAKVWDREVIEKLTPENWPQKDYMAWFGDVAKSPNGKELLLPITREHISKKHRHAQNDIIALVHADLALPELTPLLIERLENEKLTIGEQGTIHLLLGQNAKAGDDKAFQYLLKTYLAERKNPTSYNFRNNLPLTLMKAGHREELKKALAKPPPLDKYFPGELNLLILDPASFRKHLAAKPSENLQWLNFDFFLEEPNEHTVPLLTSLGGQLLEIQIGAFKTLALLGPKAVSAVPYLKDLVTRKNHPLAICAGLTLLAIDAKSYQDFVIPKLRSHFRASDLRLEKYMGELLPVLQIKDEITKKKLVELLASLAERQLADPEWVIALGPSYAQHFNTYLNAGHPLGSTILKACKKSSALRFALIDTLNALAPSSGDALDALVNPEEDAE